MVRFKLKLRLSGRRQLLDLPRTYFEVDDVRPHEDELPEYTFEIFENQGLTIPKELNRKILQYLSGKDLLNFSRASKKAFWNVEFSHALMYDAIHERINDLVKRSCLRRGTKTNTNLEWEIVCKLRVTNLELDILGELKMMRTDMWFGLPQRKCST